jgi:hypothetical protein
MWMLGGLVLAGCMAHKEPVVERRETVVVTPAPAPAPPPASPAVETPPGQDPNFVPPGHGGTPPGQEKKEMEAPAASPAAMDEAPPAADVVSDDAKPVKAKGKAKGKKK